MVRSAATKPNPAASTMGAHGLHGHQGNVFKTSAHATLHCLLGCSIGEVAGLVIGTAFGLGVAPRIGLAVTLAYVSGLMLAIMPVMRSEGLSFAAALRVVWLAEVISIGVMELVMNWVDYLVGGIQAASVLNPIFWVGLLLSVPPAFLAAWPVIYWLLQKELRSPH
jgi:hypothetical protein